eukprot:258895-Hanusia_phi.AAC.1
MASEEDLTIDSDDDFEYEEVDIEPEAEEVEEEEDLESALMRVRLQQSEQREAKEPKPLVGKRAELVDDFIRNYLLKMKMTKTLDCFQTEWYEKSTAGELTPEDVSIVADVYQRNQELDNQVKALRAELDKAKEIAHKARSTWDKFRKERDFHRMNHRRVVQEKSKLVNDLRRLRAHLATYEPTLKGLEEKYQVRRMGVRKALAGVAEPDRQPDVCQQIAMKEKAMAKLQADRLQTRVDTLETQVKQTQMTTMKGTLEQVHPLLYSQHHPPSSSSASPSSSPSSSSSSSSSWVSASSSSLPPQEKSKSATQVRETTVINKKATQPVMSTDTSLLAFQDRENPYLNLSFDPQRADKYELRKTYKAHIAPISAVALHPKKSIIATASDDNTWKMWSVPGGELVLTGEGHKSWVSGIDFHPKAAQLATSSGDGTVKLWDFSKSKCLATFTDHSQ